MYLYNIRKGIAMLELVFAIVIMGIVMMSAPMLVSQANKSSLVGIQQEAIAAGATDIALILTRHWDENDTNESLESPILATDSPDTFLSEVNMTNIPLGIRVGMPILSTRSFVTPIGSRLNASVISPDTNATEFDDIDDYDGNTRQLRNDAPTTTSQGDYIDRNLTFTTSVSYIVDIPTTGGYNQQTLSFDNPFNNTTPTTSNIKMISVRISTSNTASELQKNIVLNAFSCNIGTYSIAERRLP